MIAGTAPAGVVMELFLVLVLAELVRCMRRR